MRGNWTIDEVDYLQESVGRVKISTIAQKLNRTETAVILKLKRLGLANTKSQTGLLTVSELAKMLQVDINTVKGWVTRHGLNCIYKTTRNEKKFWFVYPEEFWKWAEVNKEKVNFAKIDYQSIIPEPCWVAVERKKTREMGCMYKNWTTHEEKLLISMIKAGNSIDDIGKELNRSTLSLKRKLDRIIG